MKALKTTREERKLSQRGLARLARVSYKSIQLIEAGAHDSKISTLQSIADALGYPPRSVEHRIEELFSTPCDSISTVSERIAMDGEGSWKDWLFNFVDAFRYKKERQYIDAPPVEVVSKRIKALLASVVESLCAELEIQAPLWCFAVPALDEPWFVSGVESLKPTALVESPVWFRMRNIFVLKNFLDRR